MSKIDFVQQAAAPATPSASHIVMYAKTDGLGYYKDDAGTEHVFGVGPTAVGAGTNTGTTGTVVFNNANGITFGASSGTGGVTITGSTAAQQVTFWENMPIGGALNSNGIQGNSGAANVTFQRVIVPYRATWTRLDFLAHLTQGGSTAGSYTASVAIYTLSKSSLSSASSDSIAVTFNSGTNATAVSIYGAHSGTRWRSIALGSWNMTPGEYMLAFAISVNGPAGSTLTMTVYGQSSVSLNAAVGGGDFTAYFSDGIYSAGTGAYPSSVHLSDINQTGANVNRQPYLRFVGTF